MAALDLKPFLMQFSLNSKNKKIFCLLVYLLVFALFLSYNVTGKPRTSNKSTKMQRISKHKIPSTKTKNLAQFPQF